MKRTKQLLALMLSLLLVLVLAACGGGTTSGSTPAGGDASGGGDGGSTGGGDASKVAVAYTPDIFNTCNPFATNAYSDAYIFNQAYETMAVVDDDGVAQPCLATSWDVSDDGMTYTVHLVGDAVFHNGETLTADDVVFTYEYAKDFASRTGFFSMVTAVEAIDDTTVEFTLDAPTPLFMVYSQEMPILNRKFVDENGGDISKVTCGTGPYEMTNFDPAVKVEMTSFKDYRLGAAAIENIELRYISDKSSAVIALETGEIHYMSVPTTSAPNFLDNADYNTQLTMPSYTALIAFNSTKPPFDDIKVRQAFSYACDKKSIIEIAADGYGTEARLQAYTNSFGVDYTGATDFSYNPEKAKELLAEAGYPDGMNLADFGIQLKTFAGYHSKIAQIYQQNLADIGVTTEIVNTETPDEDVEAGDFGFMNQGASWRADFSYCVVNYGTVGIGGNNYSRMSEPYVDEMFDKGVRESDPEKRKEIYKELVAYLIDYCPTIPIFHKEEIYVWPKSLNAVAYDNANHPFYCYDWSWA